MTPALYDPAAEVVSICQDLIRIDTSNHGDDSGPGERAAAEYVAASLDDVGIRAELFESRPGRTSLVARWGGGTSEPLMLHGHLDVVPAEAADWTHHPFSGEVIDGCLWGRGAVDMKDFDAMVLSVVRARARAGIVPKRPIALVFTADEETGGSLGAQWLVDHHRDLIEDCTVAIGEAGGFSTTVRDHRVYLIQAAEKGMAWMRLTARGVAAHGSMIQPRNPVVRLANALARLSAHSWPVRPTPVMRALLQAVTELTGTEATPDSIIEEFGPAAKMLGASLRDTVNPTMFQAGYTLNVVPAEAVAHVDGRMLPGHEDEFYATVARLVGDDIDIDWITRLPGVEAPVHGTIVDAMNAALLAHDPGSVVAPYMTSGGTDAKHWSQLGMRCYGYAPLKLPPDLDFHGLFHGVDERVPVDALTFGARVLDDLLTIY